MTDRDARAALGESLSEELGCDLTPELMLMADRLLARFYSAGFIVIPAVSSNLVRYYAAPS